MKILIILNDPPYGTERSYNGLRLARAILKGKPDLNLTVFLMADAVACAKQGQKVPCGSRKREYIDSIAYFWAMNNPWIHGSVNPIPARGAHYDRPNACIAAAGDSGPSPPAFPCTRERVEDRVLNRLTGYFGLSWRNCGRVGAPRCSLSSLERS